MLQRKGAPDNYIVKHEDLYAAAYLKLEEQYPLLEGPLNWLEWQLVRDPIRAGMPCELGGEDRDFRVAKSPPFDKTPSFRVLYEVDGENYVITLWSLGYDAPWQPM